MSDEIDLALGTTMEHLKRQWRTYSAAGISLFGLLCWLLTFVVQDEVWSAAPASIIGLMFFGCGRLWYIALASQVMALMVYRLELPGDSKGASAT